ncbi:MAG: hypothetical protein R3E58_08585 [Phycisphaerae bacterium]
MGRIDYLFKLLLTQPTRTRREPHAHPRHDIAAGHARKDVLSRTIQNDENVKIVLFGFAAGEELSRHTASMPAIMHFLSGQADVTLVPGHRRHRRNLGSYGRRPEAQHQSQLAREDTVDPDQNRKVSRKSPSRLRATFDHLHPAYVSAVSTHKKDILDTL